MNASLRTFLLELEALCQKHSVSLESCSCCEGLTIACKDGFEKCKISFNHVDESTVESVDINTDADEHTQCFMCIENECQCDFEPWVEPCLGFVDWRVLAKMAKGDSGDGKA